MKLYMIPGICIAFALFLLMCTGLKRTDPVSARMKEDSLSRAKGDSIMGIKP